MSPEDFAKLLLEVAKTEGRKHLPDYVKDNWVDALVELAEAGLLKAWAELLDTMSVVRIETNTVEVVDERE